MVRGTRGVCDSSSHTPGQLRTAQHAVGCGTVPAQIHSQAHPRTGGLLRCWRRDQVGLVSRRHTAQETGCATLEGLWAGRAECRGSTCAAGEGGRQPPVAVARRKAPVPPPSPAPCAPPIPLQMPPAHLANILAVVRAEVGCAVTVVCRCGGMGLRLAGPLLLLRLRLPGWWCAASGRTWPRIPPMLTVHVARVARLPAQHSSGLLLIHRGTVQAAGSQAGL